MPWLFLCMDHSSLWASAILPGLLHISIDAPPACVVARSQPHPLISLVVCRSLIPCLESLFTGILLSNGLGPTASCPMTHDFFKAMPLLCIRSIPLGAYKISSWPGFLSFFFFFFPVVSVYSIVIRSIIKTALASKNLSKSAIFEINHFAS